METMFLLGTHPGLVWARIRVPNFTERGIFFIDFACPRFYENTGNFIVNFLVFT